MPTKVLLIDDHSQVTQTLKLSIKEKFDSTEPWEVSECNDFAAAENKIQEFNPDLIVLDILLTVGGTETTPGDEIFQKLWNGKLRPVIFFSAGLGDIPEKYAKETIFVTSVEKQGATSDYDKVVAELKRLETFRNKTLEASKAVVEAAEGGVQKTLRYFTSEMASSCGGSLETIGNYTLRKIVASLGDSTQSEKLLPWERYLYPPVSTHLLAGDIIRMSGADGSAPSSYRVILSPSCDLARNKIEQVLVAVCEEGGVFVSAAFGASPPSDAAGLRNKLKKYSRLLNDCHQNGVVCLPDLPGIFPIMALNLKNLQVIPRNEITPLPPALGSETGDTVSPTSKYVRIASMDSPFRERLIYAFSQVNSIPGIPDIELDKMVGKLADCCFPGQ